MAELYDPDTSSWFYVEPQNAELFGINASHHILFWEEPVEELPENYINLELLVDISQYNMGIEALSYEMEFISAVQKNQ